MDILELRNFLRSEGEELASEAAIPTIDISENTIVDICDAVESEGLDTIIRHLGTISNSFKTENDFSCSTEVLSEAVKLIHVSLERLSMEINAAQGNARDSLAKLDRALKHKLRKYMAVLFFLIHQSFIEIERAVTAESHNISIQMASNGKGSRKGKKQVDDFEESKYQFWFYWRPKIVQQLWKLVAPPMHEIWEGSHEGGFNFMRCLTLALCTAIKNKAKRLRSMDDEAENMFDTLGILACKHQEQKGILARLIPLLKGSEETANIVAGGIDRMINLSPDQAKTTVLSALSEALDIYMARFDKESGQERGFHSFLTQLCFLQPEGAMNSLPVIIQFLDSDSQIVRNAVLVVAHELLNYSWKKMNEEQGQENGDEREQGEVPNSRVGDRWHTLRHKLLNEILLHHMRDSNSFVRTKATNLLADLVKNRMIGAPEAVEILSNVKLRLLDKTVTARKAATTLVIDLVNQFPHMVDDTNAYIAKREQKIQEIVTIIQNDETNAAKSLYFIIKEFISHTEMSNFTLLPSIKSEITNQEIALNKIEEFLKNGQYWHACEALYFCMKKFSLEFEQMLAALRRGDNDSMDEIYLRFFKASYDDVFPDAIQSLDLTETNYIAPDRVERARDFLGFLYNIMAMQVELEKCQPSLRKLLELGTTTDKKEAVLFYAAICKAGFKPSQSTTVSIINALAQLNAEELGEFVEPFLHIFIDRNKVGSVYTVEKLLELVQQLSENLVESLSGMIGELYRSHILDIESVQVLWDAFSLANERWNPNQSKSAAYILGIIGQIQRDVVTTNFNRLIEVGLGERGLEDFELAKVTLQTVLYGCRLEPEFLEPEVPAGKGKKATKAVKKNNSGEGIKFPPTHDLFSKIVALVEKGLKEEGNDAMDFMYPRVVELSTQIIYRMCTDPNEVIRLILPNIHGFVFAASSSASSQEHQNQFGLSEKILFRYMSFGKALLGAHITYYEQVVTKEIKKRKQILEKHKKKSKTNGRERSRKSSVSTLSNASMNQSSNDAANEMDVMIGNIGFDAEADSIKTYVAKLLDTGFFRNFRIHVLYLCQVFDTIKSLNLKISVVQALAKLMLICEASVNKHLQYLLKLWSGNESFAVKLEILKASIRLTVKFPNQMEKMNDGFSSGLAHEDARVRKACMDYIQYLALSDLLKVREQLSDCAACLCDESFELREMARDFINQIAEKDNVLQNCIPDIISRLSSREDITQEKFQNIMKTLLTKIKKEKQLGGLVERIVGRFKGPVPARVCQDTAYCLTQIQHNDKTFKIMKDNLNIYADKLGDEFVWEYFQEILGAIKKLNKPDLKLKIEEWEKDLEDNHSKCVALNNAQKAAKRNEKRQKLVESESSSDEEDNEPTENGGGNQSLEIGSASNDNEEEDMEIGSEDGNASSEEQAEKSEASDSQMEEDEEEEVGGEESLEEGSDDE